MALRHTILVLLASLVALSSAGLLETLLSWELPDTERGSLTTASTITKTTKKTKALSKTPPLPQSKCLCQISGCLCCVDLNLTTSIDLGGPACVNIRQKDQNVSLNLSYSDNPVHNATIRIAEAANRPTCMNLLSDLAQICAKFPMIKSNEPGYDGCLVIEPTLLGSPQATYHMGCFNFNQNVRQIDVPTFTETTEASVVSDVSANEDEEDDIGINTDELIAAVSASAEHGIALFSQWLGLTLSPKLNFTGKYDVQSHHDHYQQQQQQQGEEEHQQQQQGHLDSQQTTSRSARNLVDAQREKSEERFKQLLSAQNNVLKGSATIGQANGAQTTFVYSRPVEEPRQEQEISNTKTEGPMNGDDSKLGSQRLTVIPRESRRGGKAYNIHQHVNEI